MRRFVIFVFYYMLKFSFVFGIIYRHIINSLIRFFKKRVTPKKYIHTTDEKLYYELFKSHNLLGLGDDIDIFYHFPFLLDKRRNQYMAGLIPVPMTKFIYLSNLEAIYEFFKLKKQGFKLIEMGKIKDQFRLKMVEK